MIDAAAPIAQKPAMSAIEVAAFYEFAALPHFADLREPIHAACTANGVRGICLLAPEGINGTLAGSPEGLGAALAEMRALTGLILPHKSSFADKIPFRSLRVRLKKEIVTLGEPAADPTKRVGTYVDPENWNALISDPDVLVLDTRNHFEVEVGTFQRAVDPMTKSFGQFPAFVRGNLDPGKHRRVAMFCTGGIRCEKASAFMLNEGFTEVFHLRGGILKYLETVPQEQSLWDGGCFVFDQRTSVGHGLEVLPIRICTSCQMPLTAEAIAAPGYEEGVSCPACVGTRQESWVRGARERMRQKRQGERMRAQPQSSDRKPSTR